MTARSLAPAHAVLDETRYEIERKLGEGGAGSVFLVRDRETGEQLALKKLFRMDAKSVLRLKREFRSLQAVNHPHLIKLYDMGQASDAWFLTMEYLDGVDLARYLGVAESEPSAPRVRVLDRPRLLPAFRQLAQAIQALHSAGFLHRDLKPSNVLVVQDRVVVLDFGLVRELSASAATLTEDGAIAGTPAYMAPEQLRAEQLTAASDWYAFGAMLYEAVSSRLPIDGPLLTLLRAKLESDPVPLSRIAPGVPAWLDELCMSLLCRDPARRPTGQQILARLEAPPLAAAVPLATTSSLLVTDGAAQQATLQLRGRAVEERQLWSALAQAEAGGAVVVHVHGASGAGKSALVEHFLAAIEKPDRDPSSAQVLVLRSRCYELEAMPFKALDGVMDALVRHLARLEDLAVAHLLPSEVVALTQIFPVLERLNAVKRLTAGAARSGDALLTRSRAEAAMRALLDNLAARAPVVVWVDDLQWGDLDSARILRNWIAQPSAAPLLFVFSYRSDEIGTSTCLRKLLDEDPARPARAATHTVEVSPLGTAEIAALCEAHIPAHVTGRTELTLRIVREAQGSPFLASQLLALVQAKSARGDTDLHTVTLDLMVAQTSALLSEDAKVVLAFLAVAGRPMSPKLVVQAAGLPRAGRALVHDLRGLNLVRTREVGGARMLEVYHDQVRERVYGSLSSEERQRIHERLLRALEFSGLADQDWLHSLALGAGQHALALQYGQSAAARASEGLAFERAAGLYKKCLELAPAADSCELWSLYSSALARCGRGLEAGEAALECAKRVPQAERVAWLHRAVTHFLRSGHFAQGEALVDEVLKAKQIDVPTSDAGLMAAILWERTRIKLLGTHDRVRPKAQIKPEQLERFDLLLSLSRTQLYHPLRATLFRARALRTALENGETHRLVMALCLASAGATLFGTARAARESAALFARAAAVNATLEKPEELLLCTTRVLSAWNLGKLDDALALARDAERLLRSDSQFDPMGNYFTRFLIASVRLGALYARGDMTAFVGEARGALDEALALDNRALLLQSTYTQTLLEQLEGQTALTQSRLERQQAELPRGCFGFLHVLHLTAVMCHANWSGDCSVAADYVTDTWQRFQRAARATDLTTAMAFHQHVCFVLNQLVAQDRRGQAAHAVAADLRVLEALPQVHATYSAHYTRARVAYLAGDRGEAAQQLLAACTLYEDLGYSHNGPLTRYALGLVLGGTEGEAMRTLAEQRMQQMGLPDVAAEVRAYFPELMGSTAP